MKRVLLVFMAFFVSCTTEAAPHLSSVRGVWSSDSAETVITDSICIFYYRAGNTLQAVFEVPSIGIF